MKFRRASPGGGRGQSGLWTNATLPLVLQGERCIRSASPSRAMTPVLLPPGPQSAPLHPKATSGSPKSIFPYPPHHTSSPKSPRRLSFSGIFRSSSSCSSTSLKLFSRTRRGELHHPPHPKTHTHYTHYTQAQTQLLLHFRNAEGSERQ